MLPYMTFKELWGHILYHSNKDEDKILEVKDI